MAGGQLAAGMAGEEYAAAMTEDFAFGGIIGALGAALNFFHSDATVAAPVDGQKLNPSSTMTAHDRSTARSAPLNDDRKDRR